MRYWQESLISINATIMDAVHRIDESGLQMAVVVDDSNVLKGTEMKEEGRLKDREIIL